MFNSFVKKLKTNILYIKSNLLFFIKLVKFNYLLNILYLIIIFDCLININSYNFFICSFIDKFFYFINPLYSLIVFLTFYFLISIKDIIILKLKNLIKLKNTKFNLSNSKLITQNYYVDNNNFNNIFLFSLYYIYNITSIKVVISYIYNWYLNFFKYNFSNLFISRFILNKLLLENVKPINWYPIFKRHSIFGYYRINRQRWVELKSEEINYIKY